jgi:beta-galactosidase
MSPLPTVFRKLVGAYVEEYNPIGYGTVKVRFSDSESFTCRRWCDILHTETAKGIAFYDESFFCGKPAVTANKFGTGKAYYIGTVGEKSFYRKLIRTIIADCGLDFTDELPDNVELTKRMGKDFGVRFIFNNSDKPQHFTLSDEGISLKPFEMKIDKYPIH